MNDLDKLSPEKRENYLKNSVDILENRCEELEKRENDLKKCLGVYQLEEKVHYLCKKVHLLTIELEKSGDLINNLTEHINYFDMHIRRLVNAKKKESEGCGNE